MTEVAEVKISLHKFSEHEVRRIAAHGGMFIGRLPVSYTILPGGEIKHAAAVLMSAPGVHQRIELGDWVMKCGDEYFLLKGVK